METMRYQENKKSYKGAIFGFFAFVIIGSGLIAFAISQEKEPQVVGQKANEEVQSLVDVSEENNEDINAITFEVKDEIIKDKENAKIKANITIPQVSIQGEALTQINAKIKGEYTSRFESLKSQLKSAENKFTYTVTYHQYDNVIKDRRILSLTIYQRVLDDASKKTTTDKVESFNIDLATKEIIDAQEIMVEMFGKEYKEKVNNAVKSYIVNKGYQKESEVNYTVTGLENYYIKDEKLHILLNEDEVVEKKYGVLDITVE